MISEEKLYFCNRITNKTDVTSYRKIKRHIKQYDYGKRSKRFFRES